LIDKYTNAGFSFSRDADHIPINQHDDLSANIVLLIRILRGEFAQPSTPDLLSILECAGETMRSFVEDQRARHRM
jgi:hypothetical protein